MLLRPRKFSYKNSQKKRSINLTISDGKLRYGNHGVLLLQPFSITSKRLFRLKLFLKRASRRSDKTGRKLWLNAFPHLPLTKKVAGSRMGKGKGKLNDWYSKLPYGKVLLEYKNLRRGRFIYYFNQLKHRLSSKVRPVEKHISAKRASLPVKASHKMTASQFS